MSEGGYQVMSSPPLRDSFSKNVEYAWSNPYSFVETLPSSMGQGQEMGIMLVVTIVTVIYFCFFPRLNPAIDSTPRFVSSLNNNQRQIFKLFLLSMWWEEI